MDIQLITKGLCTGGKKNMRKMILVCFLLCVVLSGCGKEEVEDVAMTAPNITEGSNSEDVELPENDVTDESTSLQLPENCIPKDYSEDVNITSTENLLFGNYYFGEDGHSNDRTVVDSVDKLYTGYSKEVSGFGTVSVYINKIYMLDDTLDSYVENIKDEGSWIYSLSDKEIDSYPEIPDNALEYGHIIAVQPDYWVFLYAYPLETGYMEIRMGVPVNYSDGIFSTPDNVENEFTGIVEALLNSENVDDSDME